MLGGVGIPTWPGNAASLAATSKERRRAAQVTLSLPENPSHSKMLEKLGEQAHAQEQEAEDVLVDFMQTQRNDKPQNAKEFGERLPRVEEPIAALAMVHEE